MGVQTWTFIIVAASFALYIGIAIATRAGSTKEFYVAGGGVPPLANGMATAADWMSAASFISMAGIISFAGYDGSVYLLGWTGGYVLLALLLAPYLRKFGKFTVPDFVGDRYYSKTARIVAVVCAIFVSFTYVAGQMRGVGVVFSRFLEVPIETGVYIGMGLVFVYAVLGGMKGITYTQVAQYVILMIAFLIPAIFISLMLTNNPIPQLGFGANVTGEQVSLLSKLDGLHAELGFAAYTDGTKGMLDMLCMTAALMVGTAGLPHVIVRFYTVPKVKDARSSAGWALLFIAALYTAAPAVAAFARTNLITSVDGARYADRTEQVEGSETPAPEAAEAAEAAGEAAGAQTKQIPEWFRTWEDTQLIAWVDKNGDGVVQYRAGTAFEGKPDFSRDAAGEPLRGDNGEWLVENAPSDSENELYIDRDIIVLANPEIADLPDWVVALVAAGALAAALSTAAGLLLVVSTAISHDLVKRVIAPDISERRELMLARVGAAAAVIIAGYFGIHPPGFVAQVVALAFGLAASTFFPAIILGIFSTRANREGVVSGMLAGLFFTSAYIGYFKFLGGTPDQYWLGISPEGIGTVGMCLNFVVAIVVGRLTPPPPPEIQRLVEDLRVPKHGKAGEA
ncbi:cation acetate symporter [Pseudenhygromyxa sp. WMMC2535]|uniref:sodium:solute symporter family protein n=1 Tax=Pseudenhygromyxa sp. WMMC2535 TaxID=2712867 RepID=UPI00155772C0|nr:sodium:solute symporter family protein [Pseudenhygromyxa sp. WMMC2535]NVB40660.1 cation acetate symporter [Pseudenhygromyxa sp. WMMC2535]